METPELRSEGPPSPRKKIIEITNLTKIYSTKDGNIHAIDDINLHIYEREFVTMVGRSGCGKTTILKIMTGLLPKTRGSVKISGEEVTGPAANVGIVFQAPVLPPWRTVFKNVMLPIEILKFDSREYEPKAMELLKLVGLEGFEHKYPRELSGGMQQRVAISRALIHDPPLLLLDEPFGALDALTREEMNLELLRIWGDKKKTSLLITHSISEAIFLGDRVVVMTPRPGSVDEIITIELPRPRLVEMRHTSQFGEYVKHISAKIGLGRG